jgi:O-antigen ligase
VSSTFIARNCYAAYAGLGLLAVTSLILRLYRHHVSESVGSRRLAIATAIETTGREGAALLGAGFLISVAVVLTGSRGGVSATGVGLLMLGVLTARREKRTALSVATVMLGSLFAAALLFAFGDPLIDHFRERGISDTSRGSVYLLTMRSILDMPLFGYGYGTFVDVFPMYRDRSIGVYGIWDRAHDTYLEIFQGLGLVFGSMLLISVILLVWRCIKSATMTGENLTVSGFAAAAAMLLGVHALVDFSLQIQAVALTLAASLGAGVAQAERVRHSSHTSADPQHLRAHFG